MKRCLYIASLVLVISWIIGAFFFHAGSFVHMLLFVSIISAMQALMICPKAGTAKRQLP